MPPSYGDLFMMAIMNRLHLLQFPEQVYLREPFKTLGNFILYRFEWKEPTGEIKDTPYYAITLNQGFQESIDIGFIGQAESDINGFIQRIDLCQQVLHHALVVATRDMDKFIESQAQRLKAIITIKQGHYNAIQDALSNLRAR